jgi:hypothetical protein
MPAKTDQPAPAPWSVPLPVAQIPDGGLHREIEADAAVRAAVAIATGLRDVTRLVARFDIQPMAGGRISVGGHVSAVVGQNCVVTLEPLDSQIEEDLEVVFSEAAREAPGGAAELEVDPEADDPPEPLRSGAIDLGAVATEFLVLGINPYPRKSDVVFEPPAATADPGEHPFAALKALKDKPLKS